MGRPGEELPRVLSLLPAATDIVVALGLGDRLVGRSHECDADGTGATAVCTESKYSAEHGLTAHDVHDAASTAGTALWEAAFGPLPLAATLVEWGLSPYRTDAHLVREMRPDVVLTQVQACGGAASQEEVEQALEEWLGRPVTLVHLDPQRLADVWHDMVRVGEALGVRETALAAVRRLRARMARVQSVARGRPKRRVVCVQWTDPLFLAGAWVPEMVRLAGGVDVARGERGAHAAADTAELERGRARGRGRAGEPTPALSLLDSGGGVGDDTMGVANWEKEGGTEATEEWEEEGSEVESGVGAMTLPWSEVAKLRPDNVVFAICGSGLQESMREAMGVMQSEVWKELGSRRRRVAIAVVDAARLFSRPGPSLVESLEVLAEVLHPESHSFGHKGVSWRPIEV